MAVHIYNRTLSEEYGRWRVQRKKGGIIFIYFKKLFFSILLKWNVRYFNNFWKNYKIPKMVGGTPPPTCVFRQSQAVKQHLRYLQHFYLPVPYTGTRVAVNNRYCLIFELTYISNRYIYIIYSYIYRYKKREPWLY